MCNYIVVSSVKEEQGYDENQNMGNLGTRVRVFVEVKRSKIAGA